MKKTLIYHYYSFWANCYVLQSKNHAPKGKFNETYKSALKLRNTSLE